MEKRRRIEELREQTDEIDRVNGELQAQIQELEKELELTRASLSVYEQKENDDSIFSGFAVPFLVMTVSLWLMFK